MHEQDDDGELERLFERVQPEVPADAAERVLAGLGTDRIERELYRGEFEAVGRRALRYSVLGALLGLAALVVCFSLSRVPGHSRARHYGSAVHSLTKALDLHSTPRPAEPTELSHTFAASRRDERLLSDPFCFLERN